MTIAIRALPQLEAAARLEPEGERNSEEWKKWRQRARLGRVEQDDRPGAGGPAADVATLGQQAGRADPLQRHRPPLHRSARRLHPRAAPGQAAPGRCRRARHSGVRRHPRSQAPQGGEAGLRERDARRDAGRGSRAAETPAAESRPPSNAAKSRIRNPKQIRIPKAEVQTGRHESCDEPFSVIWILRFGFVSRFRASRFADFLPCGFDFTHHVGRVCADMAAQVDEFRHIDMSRVAVSFRQTRKRMSARAVRLLDPLAVRRRPDALRFAAGGSSPSSGSRSTAARCSTC